MGVADTVTCFLGSCENPVFVRGLCRADYQALWSRGLLTTTGRPGRPPHTRDRILDVLETDGGWLTVAALEGRVHISQSTLRKALWRMRRDGLLVSRPTIPSGVDPTLEWSMA